MSDAQPNVATIYIRLRRGERWFGVPNNLMYGAAVNWRRYKRLMRHKRLMRRQTKGF